MNGDGVSIPIFEGFFPAGFGSSMSTMWLVDLERSCSLLIGHCLGDMLLGAFPSEEEAESGAWLTSQLFSNGLNGQWDGKPWLQFC